MKFCEYIIFLKIYLGETINFRVHISLDLNGIINVRLSLFLCLKRKSELRNNRIKDRTFTYNVENSLFSSY
jgi:hypothetical protein